MRNVCAKDSHINVFPTKLSAFVIFTYIIYRALTNDVINFEQTSVSDGRPNLTWLKCLIGNYLADVVWTFSMFVHFTQHDRTS